VSRTLLGDNLLLLAVIEPMTAVSPKRTFTVPYHRCGAARQIGLSLLVQNRTDS
jgi:hypothetical protein